MPDHRSLAAGRHSENQPLTAIRGFAALWVVVGVHLQETWAFPVGPRGQAALLMGHVAVDVFFILSGFILTLVYPTLGRQGTGRFLLRRICRIYPLHLCIMTVLGLAGLYTQLTRGETHPWGTFWPAVLLVQPYLGIITDWNVASWSLGVEFICYALFPLVNTVMRSVERPGLAVLTLAITELVVLQYYDDVVAGPGAVFRALGGFFLGCALARLGLRESLTFVRHATLLQTSATAVLAVAVLVGNDTAAVLAAAVLIAAIAAPVGPVVRLLSTRPLVWLGQVSFSIYLLHIPLLGVFGKLSPIRAALAIPPLRFAVAGMFLAVLLVASGITYRLIERPFRRIPDLLTRRAGAVAPTPSGIFNA